MKKAQIIIAICAVILIAIGIGGLYYYPPGDIDKEQEEILRPTEIKTITEEPIENGEIEKQFIHGDTIINYTVGVENGVEETPAPSVLKAMSESYTESEKEQRLQKLYESDWWKERRAIQELNERHSDPKVMKKYIDENFTCDNYNELAWQFKDDNLYGVGFVGPAEDYIYTRAINECIDPEHLLDLQEVMQKLKEVNEPN